MGAPGLPQQEASLGYLSKKEAWPTSARGKPGLHQQEGSLAYLGKGEAWPASAKGKPGLLQQEGSLATQPFPRRVNSNIPSKSISSTN